MYALFGAGLYDRNGFNPMVSAKIWTTYIRHPSTAATQCRALVPQQHKHKHSGEVSAGLTKTTTWTSSKNIELCHPSHDGNVSHRGQKQSRV